MAAKFQHSHTTPCWLYKWLCLTWFMFAFFALKQQLSAKVNWSLKCMGYDSWFISSIHLSLSLFLFFITHTICSAPVVISQPAHVWNLTFCIFVIVIVHLGDSRACLWNVCTHYLLISFIIIVFVCPRSCSRFSWCEHDGLLVVFKPGVVSALVGVWDKALCLQLGVVWLRSLCFCFVRV